MIFLFSFPLTRVHHKIFLGPRMRCGSCERKVASLLTQNKMFLSSEDEKCPVKTGLDHWEYMLIAVRWMVKERKIETAVKLDRVT
jgi:hypothetical protein